MKTVIAIMLFSLVFFSTLTGRVFALEIPQFTSCLNTSGEIKANYETGTHGIVGSTASFSGKDTVYTLSPNTLAQCFCSADGSGIQTNWWKVSSLTENEIEQLKSQGWKYVTNGALWGLEEAPYLAFNSDYICKSSGGSGEGSSSNSGNSGSTGGSGGVVAGISAGAGAVLGLASTGNSKFFYGVLLTSVISLLLGLILKKRTKNFSSK